MMGGVSLTGLLLLLAVNYLLGGDLSDVLQQIDTVPREVNQRQVTDEYEGLDSYEDFTSRVLGSNNTVWQEVFARNNLTYEEPTLVLFRQATQSGCGYASSQVGPHYCPLDGTIYIDETFFDELTSKLGAQGGDVAEAYVISHEVGHHVQNLLGRLEKRGSNEDSIAIELQADCYAGIWAHSLRDENVFETGEIQEAMDAAAAVGDDRIQEKVTGQVNPETWTHGSSEERVRWFTKGYETGDVRQCDAI